MHDADIAECFAIEALGLVDHFDFLDKYAAKAKRTKTANVQKAPPTSKAHAPADAGCFLNTNDLWTTSYFDPSGLHSMDRELWAKQRRRQGRFSGRNHTSSLNLVRATDCAFPAAGAGTLAAFGLAALAAK